jgi:hypothetical protein
MLYSLIFSLSCVSSILIQPSALEVVIIYLICASLCLHIAGLYDPLTQRRHWQLFYLLSISSALGLFLYQFIIYFTSLRQIGRIIFLKTLFLGIIYFTLAGLEKRVKP